MNKFIFFFSLHFISTLQQCFYYAQQPHKHTNTQLHNKLGKVILVFFKEAFYRKIWFLYPIRFISGIIIIACQRVRENNKYFFPSNYVSFFYMHTELCCHHCPRTIDSKLDQQRCDSNIRRIFQHLVSQMCVLLVGILALNHWFRRLISKVTSSTMSYFFLSLCSITRNVANTNMQQPELIIWPTEQKKYNIEFIFLSFFLRFMHCVYCSALVAQCHTCVERKSTILG